MHRSSLLLVSSLALLTAACAVPPSPSLQASSQPVEIPEGALTFAHGKVAASLVSTPWNPANPRPTCKVFHHIYSVDGTLLTKGLGGTFGHHRGLFVGWNRTLWNGKSLDFWHLNKGESQRFTGQIAPSLLGMGKAAQVLSIDWVAPTEEVVITELRGLEVVEHSADHYVLHMRVECRADNGPTKLSGDPQHAGQQFRALQKFADKGAAPVRYLRPTGAKDHGNNVWTECAWIAGIMGLDDVTVTVLRIEGDGNPGKTTWSTRPYGRFGATRTATVTKEQPMRIDQFYVIANGERDANWCAEQASRWRNEQQAQ